MRIQKLIIILISSMINQLNSQTVDYPAKRWVSRNANPPDKFELYNNNHLVSIICLDNGETNFSLQSWMRATDNLVGIKNVGVIPNTQSSVVMVDTLGNIISTLYTAKKDNFVMGAFVSRDYRYLLVETTKRHGIPFMSPTSLSVLRLSDGSIVTEIPNLSIQAKMDITEIPWSPDGQRFVYAVRDDRKFYVAGGKTPKDQYEEGIFIYDISNSNKQKISNSGYSASWSPSGKYIAFVRQDAVYLYDVESQETTICFADTFYQEILTVRWMPETDLLLCQAKKPRVRFKAPTGMDFFIDIHTGKMLQSPNKLGISHFGWGY